MKRIAVRAACAADAGTLAALIGELLDLHDMAAPEGLVDALARDGFGHRASFEALIAEVDGEPLGAALYYPAWRPSLAAPGLLLEDLYVRPAARRLGVGRALMTRLASLALERGCKYIEWTVERDNETARAFYEAGGARLRAGKLSYQLSGAALERLADAG